MGATASRIWADICALESDGTRVRMIETVLASPDMVNEAKRAGVYAALLMWVSDMRQGGSSPFPWSTRRPQQQQTHQQQTHQQQTHQQHPQQQQTQLVVNQASKSLNHFEDCLALLGVDEEGGITIEKLKAGYRTAALRAHPDKGGSKDAFDTVVKAFEYVKKILELINPGMSKEDKERLSAPVTMESALAYRERDGLGFSSSSSSSSIGVDALVPPGYQYPAPKAPPVHLSAKKLDMNTFNRLFEENRLPDPHRDSGYGDWMKASTAGATDDVVMDPRLKGKITPQTFERVFRERAGEQTAGTAIVRRIEPESIVPTFGTELGASADNFTAAFGAETQFMDLKEAYTTGSTRFQEVADVQVSDKRVLNVQEARRMRDAAMARVDPDEASRIAAAAAAYQEQERQRKMRYAAQTTAEDSWASQMIGRLFVTDK